MLNKHKQNLIHFYFSSDSLSIKPLLLSWYLTPLANIISEENIFILFHGCLFVKHTSLETPGKGLPKRNNKKLRLNE